MGVWALFFNDSYKKYFAKDDNIFKQAFSWFSYSKQSLDGGCFYSLQLLKKFLEIVDSEIHNY